MIRMHFIGIAGSGMSPLARFYSARENIVVSGSDRLFDQGQAEHIRALLTNSGIQIVAQDGSSIDERTSCVVVTRAVEDTIPEMVAVRRHLIPLLTRAQLLDRTVREYHGIAVAGTSGKTTVTGMTAILFKVAGLRPNVLCGGFIKGLASDHSPDNIAVAPSEYLIFEADESDGSLVMYEPETGVLLNVAKDHKTLTELREIFRQFSSHCRENLIYNRDDQAALEIVKRVDHPNRTISFGWQPSADIFPESLALESWGSSFIVQGDRFQLQVPGKHNVANALATIAVGRSYDLPTGVMQEGLETFEGVQRRLDLLGTTGAGVTVIDDFAHNPEKIAATLSTIKAVCPRLIAIFQPHGYGPTEFLKDELIESFSNHLRPDDVLLLPEIFYAGGTVTRSISSSHLVKALLSRGKRAFFFKDRLETIPWLLHHVQAEDFIVIMGARDDTLTSFGKHILTQLDTRQRTTTGC